MDYFYDGQIRRYLTQFMNVMSNFAYKDAKGQLVQVPVRYGDMSRQVAHILRKNSENSIPSAPFISCYIKDLQFDRPRMQDPTHVSKIHVRERAWDEDNQEYLNIQGKNYTVERIMPSPWKISFAADIWTTSADQKLQLWEQLAVLFNPSLEIQTTDNYIDWTSLSVLNLDNQIWSSRQVPQGVTEDIDIMTMMFSAPVWITPPAKVKQLGIITKIISNIYAVANGSIKSSYNIDNAAELFGSTSPDTSVVVTPGNYSLLVLNNTAQLIPNNESATENLTSWHSLLNLYPGEFRAGLSQLRFSQPNDTEIIAYISVNPLDDTSMSLSIDQDTIPTNTIISGRGTVDAVINPETFKPTNVVAGTRYLILEDININEYFGTVGYDGPDAWKNNDLSDFQAHSNDIIEWDGDKWNIVFESASTNDVIYITNSYTGTQYKWDQGNWTKTYEGVYDPRLWRLIL